MQPSPLPKRQVYYPAICAMPFVAAASTVMYALAAFAAATPPTEDAEVAAAFAAAPPAVAAAPELPSLPPVQETEGRGAN